MCVCLCQCDFVFLGKVVFMCVSVRLFLCGSRYGCVYVCVGVVVRRWAFILHFDICVCVCVCVS